MAKINICLQVFYLYFQFSVIPPSQVSIIYCYLVWSELDISYRQHVKTVMQPVPVTSGGSMGRRGWSPPPDGLQNLLPDTILGLQTTIKSTPSGALLTALLQSPSWWGRVGCLPPQEPHSSVWPFRPQASAIPLGPLAKGCGSVLAGNCVMPILSVFSAVITCLPYW